MSAPFRSHPDNDDSRPAARATWVPVAEFATLRFDPGATIELGEHEYAVFRHADAGERADPIVLDNSCPHAGGPLAEGRIEDGQVRCPWHGWTFELQSGACTHAPEVRVRRVPARVRDGILELWLPPA